MTDKATNENEIKVLSGRQLMLKATGLAVVFALGLLLITGVIFAVFAWSKFNLFLNTAGITRTEFKQTIKQGWEQELDTDQGHYNLLVLGTDAVTNREGDQPLTDTMLLASMNLENGSVSTLPLPRDLWSEDYQTKINALYYYGTERDLTQPTAFPNQVLSEMIQLPIHRTLVISMEQVAEIIDLLGGVEINVETAFIDEEFPRSDVDIRTETDPDVLYETIEFEAGEQIMDGETAIKYMRSRHGNNDQNTDTARSARQQQVIEALVRAMMNRDKLLDQELMGQLYGYYLENFENQLPTADVISLGKALLPVRQQIKIQSRGLSIYPDDPAGVITHPPQYLYGGQWVYEIRDEAAFAKEVREKLY